MSNKTDVVKIAYIVAGVSGAGKTTVVERIMEKHKNAAVFSLDTCRLQFFADCNPDAVEEFDTRGLYNQAFEYANQHQKEFNSFVDDAWEKAKSFDYVIVDNTHISKKSRARWSQDLHAKGFHIIGVQVVAPLSVILARQKLRNDKCVPDSVVKSMYENQQEMLVGSEVDHLINIDGTQNTNSFA